MAGTIHPEMRSTMVLQKIVALSAFGFALAQGHQAVADMPPPAGYVEQCTVAKKQTASSECVECRSMRAMYANSDRCTLLLSPYCFQKVCEALGGASYPEIWCRTKDASAPTLPDSFTSQLSSSGAPDLSSAPAPSSVTCAPYSPPPESMDSGSGCSLDPQGRSLRGFAWMLAVMASVGFVLVRLRTRRGR
jgi:hypothetical protein